MNFNKIRKFCRIFRIIVGLGLIVTSFFTENLLFLLGVIPLIAGAVDFCPLCLITKKCDLPTKESSDESN